MTTFTKNIRKMWISYPHRKRLSTHQIEMKTTIATRGLWAVNIFQLPLPEVRSSTDQ